MTPFTIHCAKEQDVPLLLALIRELAEFERLADTVEATEASLWAALFGPDTVARALIASLRGKPAGYTLFYRTFSTFAGRPGIFLEDLYVRVACRNLGIGSALLTRVAQIGVEMGGGRLEWTSLRWNENALRLYRSLGASEMGEWTLLRLDGPGVRNLARAKAEEPA